VFEAGIPPLNTLCPTTTTTSIGLDLFEIDKEPTALLCFEDIC